MRDEAVHRDTRPELRPTSHKSRSPDCKIREHIGAVTSASLVRAPLLRVAWKNARVLARPCVCARACVRVCACVCVCWRRRGGEGGGREEEEGKGCLCSQLYIRSHGNRILLMDVIFSILSFPRCLCSYVICIPCKSAARDAAQAFQRELSRPAPKKWCLLINYWCLVSGRGGCHPECGWD